MNIVLINPRTIKASTFPTGEFFSCTAPNMGLAYLAAVLEQKNHDVKIIDAQALGLDDEGLKKSLLNLEPEIIGVTATTTTIYDGFNVINIGKELYPRALTIMGGIHASCLPFETLQECSQLDAVCIGESEETVVELTCALEKGINELARVKGIAYRWDNKIRKTPPRISLPDLDVLPLPARHLLPMEHYASGGHPHRTASIVSSRGCPFKCVFCATPFIAGRRYRARSAESILSEIEQIVSKYKMNSFEFVDDLFTLDNRRVEAICSGIIERGMKVRWSCSARADTVNSRLLATMADAGCGCIFYGVESGSQRILDCIQKGESLMQIEEAVRCTREAGIQTWGFFILGFPEETREDLERTIRFACELDLDFAEFFIASAFPGSALYERAKRDDLVLMENWSDISYGKANIKNPVLFPQDVREYLIKAYRDFYTSSRVASRLLKEGETQLLSEIKYQTG
jgi:anaerobic magnesium-protoporphyrin IX monomethyl ester cyclase